MGRSQKNARWAIKPSIPTDVGASASEFPPGIEQTDGSKNVAGDAPKWLDPPSTPLGGGVNYVPPSGPNATY